MSEKVKLPKWVVDDIERYREIGCENASIIYTFASGEDKENIEFANFAADNFDLLLSALINGYEIEQTPEDKVREIWEKYIPPYNGIGANAICEVLDALNIKISGVNAE